MLIVYYLRSFDKVLDVLNLYLDIAWANLWTLRNLHYQYRFSSEDMSSFQRSIEDMLLNLKEHVSEDNAKVVY